MSDNDVRDAEQVVRDFYAAFARRDGAAMAALYAPDVRFSDPVFTDLRGANAGAMWEMLCERGTDLQVTLGDVRTDGNVVRAHWDADYTFSATGRKVHNAIDAEIEVRDGTIVRHTDSFDFRRWAAQAFGIVGSVFGGMGFFRRKVQLAALKSLDLYLSRRGS